MVAWVPFCLRACYNVHVTENREIRGSFGMELEQAIQQASNNDPLAFEELYKQYYSLVYRSIRSLVSDEDEVLDLLQDTFLKVYQKIGQFKCCGQAFL